MSCVACDTCGKLGECKIDCPPGWTTYELMFKGEATNWNLQSKQYHRCPSCVDKLRNKNKKIENKKCLK